MAKAPVKKNSSSIKRAKQSATRHARNTSIISSLKTQEKKVPKHSSQNRPSSKIFSKNLSRCLIKLSRKALFLKIELLAKRVF
ncbi:MAG: 30S ribosomal protein S20 [Verrucomicrobia bacterium]|nr:30S ribosomal protein S20 [Verrucomicrobiota bacterium]